MSFEQKDKKITVTIWNTDSIPKWTTKKCLLKKTFIPKAKTQNYTRIVIVEKIILEMVNKHIFLLYSSRYFCITENKCVVCNENLRRKV